MPTSAALLPAFGPALPELLLIAGALAFVLVGAIRGERSAGTVTAFALVLIAAVAIIVALRRGPPVATFNGAFVADAFARFMKLCALIGSGVALLMSIDFWRDARETRFEYPLLIVLSTAGMMMMISAGDLIGLYLGLELSSLATYVLCAIRRDTLRATEAGLKYFVLGALSSGMLLYGASLVYGFTGAVSYAAIAAALTGPGSTGVIFGLVFVMAGLAFKISAVPFHMWTPDVYEGAPTPVTAFLASAPKIAAMAMTVRVVISAFPNILVQWQQIVVFVSIGSMVLGAFAAIGQTNLKRLLAYSSIGNMGYALVGLAAGTVEGVQGVLVYMAIYLAMTLGSFAVLLAMRRRGGYVETITDLAGLSRTHPGLAFAFMLFVVSLAGIPPLAGFFAKWYVIVAAVGAGLYALAIIAFVTSVVGAFYYLRIVKVMYFDAPVEAFLPVPARLQVVLVLSGAFILLLSLRPSWIADSARVAALSLF